MRPGGCKRAMDLRRTEDRKGGKVRRDGEL